LLGRGCGARAEVSGRGEEGGQGEGCMDSMFFGLLMKHLPQA